MCFGGKSKATPPPTQPTRFDYTVADNSNRQQQQAAILSQSGQPTDGSTSLNSTGGATAGATTLGGGTASTNATTSY